MDTDLIDQARRVAALGTDSGAAAAVRHYDQLRGAGLYARMLLTKTAWFVEEVTPLSVGISGSGKPFSRVDAEMREGAADLRARAVALRVQANKLDHQAMDAPEPSTAEVPTIYAPTAAYPIVGKRRRTLRILSANDE